jgi:hypothetical protein
MLTDRLVLAVLGCLAVTGAQAKEKREKTGKLPPQDQIALVGHLPSSGGAVIRFLATQHYSRHYLYAEHEGGRDLTLIDVTSPEHPLVLADLSRGDGAWGLLAATGTAALVASEQSGSAAPGVPQTVRVVNFADPAHPTVTCEIAGATAITRDDSRGLIFIANREGIWILRGKPALDPEIEKEYARQVMYAR